MIDVKWFKSNKLKKITDFFYVIFMFQLTPPRKFQLTPWPILTFVSLLHRIGNTIKLLFNPESTEIKLPLECIYTHIELQQLNILTTHILLCTIYLSGVPECNCIVEYVKTSCVIKIIANGFCIIQLHGGHVT